MILHLWVERLDDFWLDGQVGCWRLGRTSFHLHQATQNILPRANLLPSSTSLISAFFRDLERLRWYPTAWRCAWARFCNRNLTALPPVHISSTSGALEPMPLMIPSTCSTSTSVSSLGMRTFSFTQNGRPMNSCTLWCTEAGTPAARWSILSYMLYVNYRAALVSLVIISLCKLVT